MRGSKALVRRLTLEVLATLQLLVVLATPATRHLYFIELQRDVVL